MKTIIFGRYPLPSAVKPNINEPVWVDWEWIVLHEDAKSALVISKDIVDWELYSGENRLDEPAKPSSWERSYARKLLAEFYKENFSFEEKSRILTNKSGDHLFILSAEDVRKYMKTPNLRIAEIRWADKDMSTEKICWWTNSFGADRSMMQIVDTRGDIYEEGVENSSDEIGIRPAMFIRSNTPALQISRFREQRKVYVFPRMVGTEEEIIRHAAACCRYAENAGRIPVLDPILYHHVLSRMPDTGLPLSAYFAAGTPIEECEDIWVFTQFPAAEIKDAKRKAALIGIPVMDMVGVRLPHEE